MEPYDAYSGYYRATSAFRTYAAAFDIADDLALLHQEERRGFDWSFDNEEGSQIDVRDLPVKSTPVIKICRNSPQRHHPQRSETNLLPIKKLSKGTRGLAWESNGEVGRNVDHDALQSTESHLHKSNRSFGRELHEGIKPRFGNKLLEPIAVASESSIDKENNQQSTSGKNYAAKRIKRSTRMCLKPSTIDPDIEDVRQRSADSRIPFRDV